MLRTLLTILLLAGFSDIAQTQSGRREARVVDAEARVGKWKEDPERLARKLATRMSPAQYRAAMQGTGMGAAIAGGTQEASAGGWTFLGPKGSFTADGANGRLAGLSINPAGGSVVYAGACQGGLWKSNLGTLGNWTSIGNTLPNPSVRAFAVDPTDPNHIFVGTGDWKRYPGAGLFETTNGGAAWYEVTLPNNPAYFYALYFDPDKPGVVLAASNMGLYRHDPLSNTWTIYLSGHITSLVPHPTDPLKWYAARADTGFYESPNDGFMWNLINDPALPPGTDWHRASIAICRDVPSTIALVVEKDGGLTGIYKSTTGGSGWSNITTNASTAEAFKYGQFSHAQAIAIKPNDPNYILVGGTELVITTNGGTSWLSGIGEHGIHPGHNDITQLQFSPVTGDNVLWIANDGGLHQADLVAKVTTHKIGSTNGLGITEIDYMDANRAVRVFGTQDNSTLRSIDAGATYTLLGGGDGATVQITDPIAKDVWFVPGAPFSLQRRNFLGSSEVMTQAPLANHYPFFYSPFDDRVYSMGPTTVWSLAEDAPATSSWALEILGAPGQDFPYNFWHLWGSRANGQALYLTYANDSLTNQRDVTIFQEVGGVWVAHHSEDVVAAGSQVVSITPSTEWPGECWIGILSPAGSPKLLHTTNYGDSWEDITGILNLVNQVLCFANVPFEPNRLFVGTDIGVFETYDGGQSWLPFQAGLPIAPCSAMELVLDDAHSTTHQLVLATNGRGLWKRDVTFPPVFYVDKNSTETLQDGTLEFPYKTVAAAVAAAPVGATVAMHTETYSEPQTVTKDVKLVTWAGSSIIR